MGRGEDTEMQRRSVLRGATTTVMGTSSVCSIGRRGFSRSAMLRISNSSGKIFSSADEAVKDVKDGSKLYLLLPPLSILYFRSIIPDKADSPN